MWAGGGGEAMPGPAGGCEKEPTTAQSWKFRSSGNKSNSYPTSPI